MTEHGTRSRYRHGQCRCSRCAEAMRVDSRMQYARRRLRAGMVDPPGRRPAGVLAEKLEELHAAGMSWRAIGERAGVAPSSAWRAARGRGQGMARATWSRLAELVAAQT